MSEEYSKLREAANISGYKYLIVVIISALPALLGVICALRKSNPVVLATGLGISVVLLIFIMFYRRRKETVERQKNIQQELESMLTQVKGSQSDYLASLISEAERANNINQIVAGTGFILAAISSISSIVLSTYGGFMTELHTAVSLAGKTKIKDNLETLSSYTQIYVTIGFVLTLIVVLVLYFGIAMIIGVLLTNDREIHKILLDERNSRIFKKRIPVKF